MNTIEEIVTQVGKLPLVVKPNKWSKSFFVVVARAPLGHWIGWTAKGFPHHQNIEYDRDTWELLGTADDVEPLMKKFAEENSKP